MNHASRLALVCLTVTAVTSACHKKSVEEAPTPVAGVNQDSIDAANRDAAEQARRDRERADAEARARARADSLRMEQERSSRMMSDVRNAIAAVIYFDFDQSEITDASRATLDAKLPILTANPGLRLRIAGHTDNRGSDEYNLALGQRRAAAAKRYLTQHGIDDGRLETVSFGEERPVAEGDDESAWSQNRRDEFEIIGGGDNLTAPRQ
jgi:peptidoglycan-associated lipoprotein